MLKKPSKYLVLTFLITWISWWMLALLTSKRIVSYGQGIFYVFYILGGFGPTIAAIIVKKQSAETEYKDFKKRLFRLKVNPLWYLWAVFVPLLTASLPWLIHSLTKGFTDSLFRLPVYMFFAMVPVMIIGGGLEEVGWRGVLLPDLNRNASKISSTLVVGAIWALWHVPLWFIKGVPQENFNFVTFAFSCISISFLFTILYLKTASIFMCILLHSFFNAYSSVLNSPSINPIVDIISKAAVCILIFLVHEGIDIYRANRRMETKTTV